MDARIPMPNKGLAEVLMSPRMRIVMLAVALEARGLFMANAPKRTGQLISSARGTVQVSDLGKRDRYMGVVRVGAPYAVWNQTGAGPGHHPKSTGRVPWFGSFEGAYTFNRVVRQMGGR